MPNRWSHMRYRLQQEGLGPRSMIAYGLDLVRAGRPPHLSGQNLIHSAIHGSPTFDTFHQRPKSDALTTSFMQPFDTASTAILIQGPIECRSDFTLETVRHYRRAFPRSLLIVSTWATESQQVLRAIQDAGTHLVVSEDTADPGPSNANRQILSTAEGLAAARRLGAEFAWKTRTDQRAYSPFAVPMLQELHRLFAPSLNKAKVAGRILVPSHNTFRNRLYGASDQMQFGCVSDLERFWDSQVTRPTPDLETEKLSEPEISAGSGSPETLLNSRYLTRSGWVLQNTHEDSLQALTDLYCVFDAASVDLFWPKYTRREYRWKQYGQGDFEEVSFAEWLSTQDVAG